MNNEYIKKAIELAEKGGYDLKKALNWPDDLWSSHELIELARTIHLHTILLDPLFYQCLGKQLGWGDKDRYNWMHYAHRGFRHIMTGKDINEFFKLIIKE